MLDSMLAYGIPIWNFLFFVLLNPSTPIPSEVKTPQPNEVFFIIHV